MRKLFHNVLSELGDFAEDNPTITILLLIMAIVLLGGALAGTIGERIQ